MKHSSSFQVARSRAHGNRVDPYSKQAGDAYIERGHTNGMVDRKLAAPDSPPALNQVSCVFCHFADLSHPLTDGAFAKQV